MKTEVTGVEIVLVSVGPKESAGSSKFVSHLSLTLGTVPLCPAGARTAKCLSGAG